MSNQNFCRIVQSTKEQIQSGYKYKIKGTETTATKKRFICVQRGIKMLQQYGNDENYAHKKNKKILIGIKKTVNTNFMSL